MGRNTGANLVYPDFRFDILIVYRSSFLVYKACEKGADLGNGSLRDTDKTFR
jgi:hypothetical protein